MQCIADEKKNDEIYSAMITNEKDIKTEHLIAELAISYRLRLSVKERNCGIDSHKCWICSRLGTL